MRVEHRGDAVSEAMMATATTEQVVEVGANEFVTLDPDFPERLPAWRRMRASVSGWLWVERYASPLEEGAFWQVFDDAGRPAGRVHVPAGSNIYEVGEDWVLGTFRNEWDVPIVRKCRVGAGIGVR